MLESLFISKVRLKILKLYSLNPAASFHVRGLVREIDEEINAVRRELQNLAQAGILTSEKQGNRVVYTVKPECNVLSELKSLFLKDKPIVQQLADMIHEFENIKIVILTKNFLGKSGTGQSDIDVLIVGEPDIDKLGKRIADFEKSIAKTLRITVMKEDEFEFRKRKRDAFLLKIFREDKVILVGEYEDLFIKDIAQ